MLLFIINRYACLCYAASGLVQLAAWGNVDSHTANNVRIVCSCNVTSRIGDISEDIMYLMFAFFAALRTYAIWDKNWTVFACVLLPGLIFPIGAIDDSHSTAMWSAHIRRTLVVEPPAATRRTTFPQTEVTRQLNPITISTQSGGAASFSSNASPCR
ncbi:hypothetical protein BC629DRAFT_1540686 [Irpex lacteus]|nr:hypothetical protein BC629DRAFT_1540686 [Irpex lacteus]